MKGLVFPELPYNKSQVYTMADDKSGCTIFIPCLNHDRALVQQKVLKKFLDNQPEPKRKRHGSL